MSIPRFRKSWLVLPLLVAAAFAVDLASTLMAQGFRAGAAESLMLAWILAFVIGLPALLLALPLARRLGAALRRHHTIPSAGVKIPDLGQ
jgi:hypothetical protein